METGLFDPFEDTHNVVDEKAWPTSRIELKLQSAPKWEPARQKEIRSIIEGRLLFEALCRNLEAHGFATQPDTSADANALNPSKLAEFFKEHPGIDSIGELVLFADGVNNPPEPSIETLELPPMEVEPQAD